MAKKKMEKGDTLVCVPCGAEYIVTDVGTAYAEAWCCGVPLKAKAAGKAPAKKAPVKKAPARKALAKKAPARKPAAGKAAPRKKR